jgi:single-strand DNA-binding protein
MNSVILTGRLTADVELRYTPGGMAVGQFNVATSRKYKQGDEWKEETSFIAVTTFGKQAENVAQYFKKGSPILVGGRLKQEKWTDAQTQKERSKTVVVMESFEFMEGKRDAGATPAARPAQQQRAAAPPPAAKNNEQEEDDVPF